MAREAADPQPNPGVLHLGEVRLNNAEVPGAPRVPHPRLRWVTMVAVFLVGAMVGSYAWIARSDLLGTAQVDLIVTDINHGNVRSDGSMGSVTITVRNIGADDLTLTRAWLPGQTSDGDRAAPTASNSIRSSRQ